MNHCAMPTSKKYIFYKHCPLKFLNIYSKLHNFWYKKWQFGKIFDQAHLAALVSKLGDVLRVTLVQEVDCDLDRLLGGHVDGRRLDLGVAEQHLGLDLSGLVSASFGQGLEVEAQGAAELDAFVGDELEKQEEK